MMSLENPEQIVSIAPAEGQKPCSLCQIPTLSLRVILTSFAMVKVVLVKKQERKITYRKYFNARLQDIDGRFARD